MKIGDKIREKRKMLNMTQQELADELDLSRTYICDLEANRYVPSLKTAARIATFMDIDLNFLIKNDGKTIQ